MVWDANRSRRPALTYITYSADVYSVLASMCVQHRHTHKPRAACACFTRVAGQRMASTLTLCPCAVPPGRSKLGRSSARKVGSPNKSAFSFRLSAAATARKGKNPYDPHATACAVRVSGSMSLKSGPSICFVLEEKSIWPLHFSTKFDLAAPNGKPFFFGSAIFWNYPNLFHRSF
jgi:hypothetical protein